MRSIIHCAQGSCGQRINGRDCAKSVHEYLRKTQIAVHLEVLSLLKRSLCHHNGKLLHNGNSADDAEPECLAVIGKDDMDTVEFT